ncbi:MAG: hypothetical protein EOP88_08675 [Verrucomicrobiaceae bacterium]|nr:MAG: hypothetical protein EOP88_08675 [Verrucomicrobiaceae bacterium]
MLKIDRVKTLFPAILSALVLCLSLHAGLVTYPDPPNGVISPVFSLTVNGSPVKVMKYMDYHYAHFAFDGTINLTVGASQAITSHKISPLSLGIQGQLAGTNLSFSMSQVPDTDSTPRYLVVQINALEKLVILGDPPETDAPAPSGTGIFNVVTGYGADPTGATYTQPSLQNAVNAASTYGTPSRPGIVYVPAGIYMVRADLVLKKNVDFYLAPGSVLKADENIANYPVAETIEPVLTVGNAENVTIRGRGEVDASGITLMNLLSRTPPTFVTQSNAHPRRRIIRTNDGGTSRNVKIRGVLCKDATGWSVELKRTLGVEAQNVKVLNHKNIRWKIENDGINVCSSSDALVNQCFVMTIDDATCSKATDAVMGSMDRVLFSNNVLWGWSAGAKAGMQNNHPMNNVVFRNIDIVHCRRVLGVDTKTSGTYPIENVLFDRIRAEETEGNWNIGNQDLIEFLLEDAVTNNITIRNLSCATNRPIRCGPNFSANNITFVNLTMNSQPITNVSQVTRAGNRTINNLVFTSTIPSVTLSAPTVHTGNSFPTTVTFSTPVTGLTAEDFVVSHGSVVGLTGGPSVYTLTVAPPSIGWVSVSLPAGVAQSVDAIGNLASNSLKIPRAAPTIPLPTVASGNLFLRFTADDLALANGAAVTNWTDSAGGRNLSGTATYGTNYANGHAGVRFNGTTDVLGNTSLTGAPDLARATLFIAGSFTTAGNDGLSDFLVSSQYPTGTSNNRLRIYKDGGGTVVARVGGGGTIGGIAADTGVHVFGLVSGRTTGAVSHVMDGRQIGSGSSGTTEPMQAFFLGANGGGPSLFADCTIGEVLLYDGALSAVDSAVVQDYLTRKYSGYSLDSDTDGLPDSWEISRFGNLTSTAGGLANSDGDALTDVQEWAAGTNPTDAKSFFTAAISHSTPDLLQVGFDAIPERRYTLESSEDMNDWVGAGSLGPVPSAGQQGFPSPIPANGKTLFFRVGVAPE